MRKFDFLRTTMMLAFMFASILVYSQPELLVHYKFDETSGTDVLDESGNAFDGTTDCETCWIEEGEIGGAIEFSGVERLDMPAMDIGLTTDEGSVAFWVKLPEESAANINCIWWSGNTGGDMFGAQNEMHIHTEGTGENVWVGGEVSFFLRDSVADHNYFLHSDPEKGGPAGNPPVNPITITDNEWHHIAGTWQPGKMALYIDGVAIWDTTNYQGAVWDCNIMTIGVANERESRRLVGAIDDFRLYAEALEIEDVEDLFNKVEPPESVEQLLADEIDLAIFPNPATANASVRFSVEAGRNVSINLFSVTGGLIGNVYEGISTAEKNIINLNTANYTPGVYFVELNIDNRVAYTKLVIQ
jgi:hypothetical protein